MQPSAAAFAKGPWCGRPSPWTAGSHQTAARSWHSALLSLPGWSPGSLHRSSPSERKPPDHSSRRSGWTNPKEREKNHGTNHMARAANFLNVQNLSENSGAVYWLVCLKNASFQIKGWYNLNFGVPNLTQPHICPRIVHFLSLRRKHNPGTPLLESPLISGQLPQSNSHHSSVRSRRLRSL